MRLIIIGLGIQGAKRLAIANKDVVATVDPFKKEANYNSIYDVPLHAYDAAILCIQDDLKIEFIEYLLKNKKHVMVEKPLFAKNNSQLKKIKNIAERNKVTLYTAYNHRFEPHFVRMKNLIGSGRLGKIYTVRLFYGNGTARLVKNSRWRDEGAGVLPDLGSHLLDTLEFWFEKEIGGFNIISATKNENRSFDNVVFGKKTSPSIIAETSLLSWRNDFYADIFAEKGSAHISSLCKWGPSKFIFRERILPSGRPLEFAEEIVSYDPTWKSEYKYFLKMIKNNENNTNNDIWINRTLNRLIGQL